MIIDLSFIEEGRRKREEGRGKKKEGKILRCLSFKLSICPNLSFNYFICISLTYSEYISSV
ncbi:hypothetical protein [Okeania sp. SIO2B3]|uniref:hypothetical protein n=1 Tax=Okeania sp. SIO2B3 TaxID=2607784 RepID=UPI0013BED880|nr:hypothetical protein [Okeania sp. SIO2B3]NET42471.1 hypothetical protein [Okeania sp. SIO2B3]